MWVRRELCLQLGFNWSDFIRSSYLYNVYLLSDEKADRSEWEIQLSLFFYVPFQKSSQFCILDADILCQWKRKHFTSLGKWYSRHPSLSSNWIDHGPYKAIVSDSIIGKVFQMKRAKFGVVYLIRPLMG